MERFLTKGPNKAHEGDVPPKTRVTQYPRGTFHASGDKLFCTNCNVVVNHKRKSTLDGHLESKKHKEVGP